MSDYVQVIASRYHFDIGRLKFAMRTFCAAVIALYLAIALGLEHPNWSVMSVLSASQPTRERLYLKGFLRVLGSVVGAIVGVLILLLAANETLLMLALLSVWIGLCVAGTVLLRGLFSYFSIVCSFTAAMVVLLVSEQPDSVWVLGMDRMLTALVGVAVASVIGALFTPRSGSPYGVESLRQSLGTLFSALGSSYDADRAEKYLLELVKVEARLDAEVDGLPRRSRQIRNVRRVISAMLALNLHHGRKHQLVSEALAEQFNQLQQKLNQGLSLDELIPLLNDTARQARSEDDALSMYLNKLAEALEGLSDPEHEEVRAPVYLHRDWSTARLAFVRVLIAFWLLGLIWVLTGWEACVYLLISATVMMSVYSSADEPLGMTRQSFIGQVIGVAAGFICIAFLWPLTDSIWLAAALVVPLLFIGAIVWAHPNLVIVGYDILMSLMLLMNPWLYSSMDFWQALPIGIAIFSGPFIVWNVFRYLLPVDTESKLQSMRRLIRHELEAMARRFGQDGIRQLEVWHARLYHRILRLAQLQHLSRKPVSDIATEGMAWFDLADSIAILHSIVRTEEQDQRLLRLANLSLQRMTRLERQRQAAGRTLQRVIDRLPDEMDGKDAMVRAVTYLLQSR